VAAGFRAFVLLAPLVFAAVAFPPVLAFFFGVDLAFVVDFFALVDAPAGFAFGFAAFFFAGGEGFGLVPEPGLVPCVVAGGAATCGGVVPTQKHNSR